jgi:hypothetical protein
VVAQSEANELQVKVAVVLVTATPGETPTVVPTYPSRLIPLLVFVVMLTSSAWLALGNAINEMIATAVPKAVSAVV